MVEYSIVISNYNMGDTVVESIESILKQVDEKFEVVVVDDGSTDQSVPKLRRLSADHDSLRIVELPPCPNRKLGATRNISVHAADGEYVLIHLDTDDTFKEGILDVVNIFKQLDEQIAHDFYLMSCGFGIAKRDFLLERGPYRNLPVGGEDQDLWRRLHADDAIIWLESENLSKEEGYKKRRLDLAKRWFRVATSNFQTGITYKSYLSWSNNNRSTLGFLYDLLVCAPLAYLVAINRESYEIPEEFQKKGVLDEKIQREYISVEELEKKYEFEINKTDLTSPEIFYLD